MDKDKKIFITKITLLFLIVLYLILPPHNKIAQIGYTFNNISFFKSKIVNNYKATEYIFHRNNAIYLTRMQNYKAAINEMNKAIATLPTFVNDNVLFSLYRDRANIEIFCGKYKEALTDYMRIQDMNLMDYLKTALLLKEANKNKLALTYCNKIINIDIKAYAGYVCIADIYAGVGKYQASVAIFDLLIDRSPNKARYYADRARYKKLDGDINGYTEDINKAKDLSPMINSDYSLSDEILHPKKLQLSIQ